MQLVAYGAQDIYLTGNPQITFFKVVYRRHTNFATEYIQQTINGTQSLGNRVTSTLSRSGDLVYDCYLESVLSVPGVNYNLSASWGSVSVDNLLMNLGTALINEVSVEIGGQQIDKQYGHSMEVWNQLTMENTSSYNVVCDTDKANLHLHAKEVANLSQRMQHSGGVISTGTNIGAVMSGTNVAAGSIRVPLQFWFNKNPGLALPLIALQYHEVELVLKLQSTTARTWAKAVLSSLKLWCNYIYLDTDERRRFAQVSHEYLIEQWQWQQNAYSSRIPLYFNHPVKELIWTGAPINQNPSTPTSVVDLSSANQQLVTLKLNGTERFAPQSVEFFSQNQVWQHHGGQGGRRGVTAQNSVLPHESGVIPAPPSICVYSFALRPEEHQPSGTCNFSRIDNAELVATGAKIGNGTATQFNFNTSAQVNVYAINYNVLRIMSGMGGLAYSN